MAEPYAIELRERVIEAYRAGEAEAIAPIRGISIADHAGPREPVGNESARLSASRRDRALADSRDRFQQGRVKRAGQTWQSVHATRRTSGLNGIMTTRGLVLSDRWDAAWPAYAATHRMELRHAA